MFAIMPTLRALFQSFIIAFLVLLYQPLQADVAADFIAKRITLKQKKKPRNTAVAVAKRMDAKEIQIECRKRDQRMHVLFFQRVLPGLDELLHSSRRLGSFNGLKSDALLPAG